MTLVWYSLRLASQFQETEQKYNEMTTAKNETLRSTHLLFILFPICRSGGNQLHRGYEQGNLKCHPKSPEEKRRKKEKG